MQTEISRPYSLEAIYAAKAERDRLRERMAKVVPMFQPTAEERAALKDRPLVERMQAAIDLHRRWEAAVNAAIAAGAELPDA